MHDLRIVLRTPFLDLGRFARSILLFSPWAWDTVTDNITRNITINIHTNIIDGVVRSNDLSRTFSTKWKWKIVENKLKTWELPNTATE